MPATEQRPRAPRDGDGHRSKTLDRGLRVLESLKKKTTGATVGELAIELKLHRTVIYRLLNTMIEHRLIARGTGDRYRLSLGVIELARAAIPTLHDAARPELTALANELGLTAYLTVADAEEVVVVATVEPAHTNVHIAYRVGFRHPLNKGASGLAILAGRPPVPGERAEVTQARRRKYASSMGELTPGAHGIAAPILVGSQPADASVGVVGIGRVNEGIAVPRLLQAAKAIGSSLS
jgi:DNA-binding IclR family transcriptional regulator